MWVPLHVHSSYSPLDGAIDFADYADWAEQHGVPAVAVTDHYTLSGAVDMERTFEGRTATPIFGCEMGCAPFSEELGRSYTHLNLWALSQKGYYNLISLVSMGYEEENRIKGKPCINLSMLDGHSDGLAVGGACEAGELAVLAEAGRFDDAWRFADRIRASGAPFYGEVMRVHDPVQDPEGSKRERGRNAAIRDFCRARKIPYLVTSDSHYMEKDARHHGTLLAVKSLSRGGKGDMSSFFSGLSLGLPEDLRSFENAWRTDGFGDGLDETVRFAERAERVSCSNRCLPLRANGGWLFPKRRTGGPSMEELARAGLARLTAEGLVPRGAGLREYEDRLEMEMGVVQKMGFPDYFLLVADIVSFARSRGMMQGAGRGSAAGSMLAWSLGITSVDPVKYGLVFERFLNPERVTMPDIDLDFEDDRRGEIIDFLEHNYGDGERAVVGISNVTRFKWKSALRDALRAHCMGNDAWVTDRCATLLSKLMERFETEKTDPESAEAEMRKTVERSEPLAPFMDRIRPALAAACGIVGKIRGVGRHASGIVVAPGQVVNYAPIWRARDAAGASDGAGAWMTQFDMNAVEHTGLIKIDILGLSQLRACRRTVELAVESGEGGLTEDRAPRMDDFCRWLNLHGAAGGDGGGTGLVALHAPRVWALLAAGDSTNVFQVERSGMRRYLRTLKPTNLDDLSALLALYRPGPLEAGLAGAFVAAKREARGERALRRGEDETGRFPPRVEKVVRERVAADTEGFPIYQEHILKMSRELAGFSLAAADILRRAMGKKKASEMERQHAAFVAGAVKNGYTEEEAMATFEVMEHFSRYGFNKAHSTAYAFLTFATAWLKAVCPASFAAAALEVRSGEKYRKPDYIMETHSVLGLLPPDLERNGGSAAAVPSSGNIPSDYDAFSDPFGRGGSTSGGERYVPALDIRTAAGHTHPVPMLGGAWHAVSSWDTLIAMSAVSTRALYSAPQLVGAGMCERTVGRLIDAARTSRPELDGTDPSELHLAARAYFIGCSPHAERYKPFAERLAASVGGTVRAGNVQCWLSAWLRTAARVTNPIERTRAVREAESCFAEALALGVDTAGVMAVSDFETAVYGTGVTVPVWAGAVARAVDILEERETDLLPDLVRSERVLFDPAWTAAAGGGDIPGKLDIGPYRFVFAEDVAGRDALYELLLDAPQGGVYVGGVLRKIVPLRGQGLAILELGGRTGLRSPGTSVLTEWDPHLPSEGAFVFFAPSGTERAAASGRYPMGDLLALYD